MWLFHLATFLVSFPIVIASGGEWGPIRFRKHPVAVFFIGLISVIAFVLLIIELRKHYMEWTSIRPESPPVEIPPASLTGPESAEQFYVRGVELAAAGRNAEAIRDFEAALQRQPDHVEALVRRGQAYMALGLENEALADFDAALKVLPSHMGAYEERRRIFDRREDALLEPLWSDMNRQ